MTSQLSVEDLLEASPDATAILDQKGQVILANGGWRARHGGDPIGADALAGLLSQTGFSAEDADRAADMIAGARRSGAVARIFVDGGAAELTASPLLGDDDRVLLIWRSAALDPDYVDLMRREYLSPDLLAQMVLGAVDAILSFDLSGRVTSWNRGAEALYGYSSKEALGRRLDDLLYPPDWPIPLVDYRDNIISGRLTSFEAVRVAKSGKPRNVWITAGPIRDAAGAVTGVSNIHRDVTEAKRKEEERAVVTREIAHRATNLLSVISALQRILAESSDGLDDFAAKFGERLVAIRRSIDLLVENGWRDASLRPLVTSCFPHLANQSAGRVTVDGPEITLKAKAVQSVGLALHELVVNAMKHGALSERRGEIAVTWRWNSDGGVAIDWRERHAGPRTATPPERDGFGAHLLRDLVGKMIDGATSLNWRPDGIDWSLTIPAEHCAARRLDSAPSDP